MAGLFRVIVELALNLHKLVHAPQGCTAWPLKRPFIIANFSLTILKSSAEQTAVNFSTKAYVFELCVAFMSCAWSPKCINYTIMLAFHMLHSYLNCYSNKLKEDFVLIAATFLLRFRN